jgi:hypothetical protein
MATLAQELLWARQAREAAAAERAREAEAAAAREAEVARTHAAADAARIARLDQPPPPLASAPAPPTGQAPAPRWRAPDPAVVFAARLQRLQRLRADPAALPALRAYYASAPWDFINDWGVTTDPRNALLSPPRPVMLPFVLFPKQAECVRWILARAQAREPGLIEKSRDCGMSWLAVALAATLCLFNRSLTVGFGSAKEDKIDRSGDPDCLFWKARTFLNHLPPEFRGGWDEQRYSAHLRVAFPETQSAIVGEAGDNIGRGGRSSIFFVDEAAHLERPALVDASLASNTDCRIDISSVAGMANSFAVKRHGGKIKVFTFHWRDDPRKGDEWYRRQQEILDPVTLAAEVDIDYRASIEGSLIPSAWIQAAVGAAEKLGIKPTGAKRAGLDVADEGADRCAIALRHGIALEHAESWSGRGSDIYSTVVRAFAACDERGHQWLFYDADGLGSGVRGDARVINDKRRADGRPVVHDAPFWGSGAVQDPEGEMVKGRKNNQFFANEKARSWWALRLRFQATWRALRGLPYAADDLISIRADLPELAQLLQQLSQPTYSLNNAGKVIVDKAPDGARSPDLADAVCIAFSPLKYALEAWLALGREP